MEVNALVQENSHDEENCDQAARSILFWLHWANIIYEIQESATLANSTDRSVKSAAVKWVVKALKHYVMIYSLIEVCPFAFLLSKVFFIRTMHINQHLSKKHQSKYECSNFSKT